MQTMRLVEGYNPPSRLRPGSLGLTLLTTGVFVSGLFFLNPHVARIIEDPLHVIELTPPPPPPQPDKPIEHKQLPQKATPYVPPTHPDVPLPDNHHVDFTPTPPGPAFPETGGTAAVIPEAAKPAPVLIGVNLDPRYASYLQPPYPAEESRAGKAGRVTLRVLVGVDGRVKDVEKVSAASDAFWDATRRQALSKWRFKPATRDGVPYEAWKVMNVSFVLNQDE
jgi:protein TonB